MRTVAVDAMGGDHAPGPEVEGAVAAVRERIAQVVLVGDEARVRQRARAPRRGGARRADGPPRLRGHPHGGPPGGRRQGQEGLVDAGGLRPCQGGHRRRGGVGGQLRRDAGVRAVRDAPAAGRRAARDRHHVSDGERASARSSTWAPTSSAGRRRWRSSRCWARSTRACCTEKRARRWASCRTAKRRSRGPS